MNEIYEIVCDWVFMLFYWVNWSMMYMYCQLDYVECVLY